MPGASPSPDHNPAPAGECRRQDWTYQGANVDLHEADLLMVTAAQAFRGTHGPWQLSLCGDAQHRHAPFSSAWLHFLSAEISS